MHRMVLLVGFVFFSLIFILPFLAGLVLLPRQCANHSRSYSRLTDLGGKRNISCFGNCAQEFSFTDSLVVFWLRNFQPQQFLPLHALMVSKCFNG